MEGEPPELDEQKMLTFDKESQQIYSLIKDLKVVDHSGLNKAIRETIDPSYGIIYKEIGDRTRNIEPCRLEGPNIYTSP